MYATFYLLLTDPIFYISRYWPACF